MNQAAFRSINTGGIHTGVSQNIRQPGQILLLGIKCPCKEMPKVMGKYFVRFHPRAFAQDFHIPPDVGAVQRFARPGGEHRPGGLFLPLQVFFQQAAQLVREKDGPPLALVGDLRPVRLHGLGGDKAQLGHPYAGGADGLHNQGQPLIVPPLGGGYQTGVLGPCQLSVFIAEQGLLDFQQLHGALPPAHEVQKTIEGSQHGVYGGRGVTGG